MSGFNYLDKALDAVLRIDKDLNIKYFSDPGLAWLGHGNPGNLHLMLHEEDVQVVRDTLSAETLISCEVRVIRKDQVTWVELTFIPMSLDAGYVVCVHDISKWKGSALEIESLVYASEHDVLTDLANRGLLEKVVSLAITQYQYTGQKFAVMLLDLDGFKKVNDTLGHHVGDEIIVQTANRLTALVRTTDLVARLGGDEFVVVLAGIQDTLVIQSLALKVLTALATPFNTSKAEVPIYLSASIGIATYPDHGEDYHLLLQHADVAMYQAKEQGRNRYVIYAPENVKRDDLSLESCMYEGIQEGEFYLVYQPKYDTKTKKIVGAEALMRWNNHKFGVVTPAHFIPLAENNGLITYLGTWSLRAACYQLKKFQTIDPHFVMSVNVSATQFVDSKLNTKVRAALTETDVDPSKLILEITETTLMLSTEKTNKTLMALKAYGLHFSMDDFGSGFSSLAYLKRFPVSELKIDKSFVDELVTDTSNQAIVKAIISIARALDLKCVAEGVESDAQLTILESLGCDLIQGYLLGEPMSSTELHSALVNG